MTHMYKSRIVAAAALVMTACGGEATLSDAISATSDPLLLSAAIGPPSFETLVAKNSNVDLNSDGNLEIAALRPLEFEIPNPSYANAKK